MSDLPLRPGEGLNLQDGESPAQGSGRPYSHASRAAYPSLGTLARTGSPLTRLNS